MKEFKIRSGRGRMESSLEIGSVRSYILFAIILIVAFCLVLSGSKVNGKAVD